MYSKLIKYDDKGNLKPLSIRESQIKCVKNILKADVGSPGDSDGRNKLYANKVISACAWIGDPNSLGNQYGYQGDALLEDAIRNCELPSNWKPDKNCKELIGIIRDHYSGGVAKEYVDQLLKSMRSIVTTTRIASARIEKLISTDEDISDDRLNVLLNTQRQLLSSAADAPKHIEALRKAVADLKVEESEKEVALGGQDITYSMRIHG